MLNVTDLIRTPFKQHCIVVLRSPKIFPPFWQGVELSWRRQREISQTRPSECVCGITRVICSVAYRISLLFKHKVLEYSLLESVPAQVAAGCFWRLKSEASTGYAKIKLAAAR